MVFVDDYSHAYTTKTRSMVTVLPLWRSCP